MVDEIQSVVNELQNKSGDLVLPMLIASSWEQDALSNLVASVDWMGYKTRKDVIDLVTSIIKKESKPEELVLGPDGNGSQDK